MKIVKKQATKPQELYTVKDEMCRRYHASATALISWLNNLERGPAILEFPSESPDQRVARAIERAFSEEAGRIPLLATIAVLCFGILLGGVLSVGFGLKYLHSTSQENLQLSERIRKADYAIETGQIDKASDILNGLK